MKPKYQLLQFTFDSTRNNKTCCFDNLSLLTKLLYFPWTLLDNDDALDLSTGYCADLAKAMSFKKNKPRNGLIPVYSLQNPLTIVLIKNYQCPAYEFLQFDVIASSSFADDENSMFFYRDQIRVHIMTMTVAPHFSHKRTPHKDNILETSGHTI